MKKTNIIVKGIKDEIEKLEDILENSDSDERPVLNFAFNNCKEIETQTDTIELLEIIVL